MTCLFMYGAIQSCVGCRKIVAMYSLQVQHLNLSRYVDMLKSAEFRDDLDVVSTIHTPKGTLKYHRYLEPSPRGHSSVT